LQTAGPNSHQVKRHPYDALQAGRLARALELLGKHLGTDFRLDEWFRRATSQRGVATVHTRVLSLVHMQFKYPVHWVDRNLRIAEKGHPALKILSERVHTGNLRDRLTAIRIRQVRAVRHCQRDSDSGMLTDPRAPPDLPNVITIAAALLRK